MSRLLKEGSDPNSPIGNGTTLLHLVRTSDLNLRISMAICMDPSALECDSRLSSRRPSVDRRRSACRRPRRRLVDSIAHCCVAQLHRNVSAVHFGMLSQSHLTNIISSMLCFLNIYRTMPIRLYWTSTEISLATTLKATAKKYYSTT